MLFSMLTAAAVVAPATAARQGLTFRPQQSNSATIEHLAESLATTDRMTVIEEASSVVNNILLQAGNATEHLEAAEKLLMEKVHSLIENDMYASMGDSHSSDDQDLKDAIAKISACNADITARQSATGDLGLMHEDAIALQVELNRLQGIVDDKRRDNDTYWKKFDDHMQIIRDPPACPDFPEPRGMAALDIYFETSEYSAWWTAARKPYFEHKRRWEAADEALKQAISEYDIYKAKRDVKFCDYKTELEAACTSFDECYASSVDHYNALVTRVKSDMNRRLEVFKAGQTLIAEVKYLLAKSKTRETPDYDLSRFELSFSTVPKKALCDLSTLTSDTWNPSISCESTDAGTYHLAPMGADTCDFGETPRDWDCRAAAKVAIEAHGIHSNGQYQESAWTHFPFGCSVREGNGKTHYSHLKKGKNNGVHQLVCSGAPHSVAPKPTK